MNKMGLIEANNIKPLDLLRILKHCKQLSLYHMHSFSTFNSLFEAVNLVFKRLFHKRCSQIARVKEYHVHGEEAPEQDQPFTFIEN